MAGEEGRAVASLPCSGGQVMGARRPSGRWLSDSALTVMLILWSLSCVQMADWGQLIEYL